ncbi:hypothetical protein LJR164_001580 [Phenylobacterium sp. LjRoot164]|uniref:hypothetical protein n=1 Tax=unclassified Phenylobacterium TaxID=2640670 RepID=UPI003ED1200A
MDWQPTRGFETVQDGDLVRFVEEDDRGAVWEVVRPATAVDVLRLLHAEYMADEECRAEVLHHLIEEGYRFTSPSPLPAHNTDASGPSEGGER